MTGTSRACVLLASMLAWPVVLDAAIIDFEEFGSLTVATSISSGGFTFAPVSGNVVAIPDANVQIDCSPDCASNGTTWFASVRAGGIPTNTQPVTMTENTGSPFLLFGLDASELFTDVVTTSLRITGNLHGGGTIITTLTLDGVNDSVGGLADFESFVLPVMWSHSLLSSVRFQGFDASGRSGDISIDNLNVSAVPEPTTLTFLGLGLAGLGFSRRRKKLD